MYLEKSFLLRRGFGPGTPGSSQKRRDFLAGTPLSFVREKLDSRYISYDCNCKIVKRNYLGFIDRNRFIKVWFYRIGRSACISLVSNVCFLPRVQ